MCERSNAKLAKAAKIIHDEDEWSHLYRSCADAGYETDLKSLMRLIYAQTRTINAGRMRYMFARVVGAKETIITKN